MSGPQFTTTAVTTPRVGTPDHGDMRARSWLPPQYGEPRACMHQAGRGWQLAVPAVAAHLLACPVWIAVLLDRACIHDACPSRRVVLLANMNLQADDTYQPQPHAAPTVLLGG